MKKYSIALILIYFSLAHGLEMRKGWGITAGTSMPKLEQVKHDVADQLVGDEIIDLTYIPFSANIGLFTGIELNRTLGLSVRTDIIFAGARSVYSESITNASDDWNYDEIHLTSSAVSIPLRLDLNYFLPYRIRNHPLSLGMMAGIQYSEWDESLIGKTGWWIFADTSNPENIISYSGSDTIYSFYLGYEIDESKQLGIGYTKSYAESSRCTIGDGDAFDLAGYPIDFSGFFLELNVKYFY